MREDGDTGSISMDIAKQYVAHCADSFKNTEQYVICQYGAAGGLLASNQLEKAGQTLLRIYDSYPL